MSFEKFLKLAQQNQDLNDNIVKKISEENKKKRDQYLKERKAIESANKVKKRVETYEPANVSGLKYEYIPSAVVDNPNKKPSSSALSKRQTEVEYIPTPIPKQKKLSSLMDALEEMNGGVPTSEKRFKFKAKIPKISGPSSESSNAERILENGSTGNSVKLKTSSIIPSQSKLNNRGKLPSSLTSTKVLSKPSIARQQGIPASSKPVHKHSISSNGTSHSSNHSDSRVSQKIPTKKSSSMLTSRSEKHFCPSNPIPSARNAPTVPIKSSPTSNRPGLSSARGPVKTNLNKAPPHLEGRTPSLISKPISLEPQKAKPICSSSIPSSSKPSHPLRGIAAQYGLAPASVTDSSRPFKAPPPVPPKNSISATSASKVQKSQPLNRHFEASKRPAHQDSKVGIPQKRPALPSSKPALTQPLRPLSSQPQNQPVKRGIAAQFGVMSSNRYGDGDDDYYEDSDDYESDDSFIDDSDCTSAKEYKIARKEIYKTLHFDPSKYAKVSKYDDLSTMESSYRQIEKEEKISLRLGAQEDKEDMEWEEERRRRRMEKLKRSSK